MKTPPPAIFLMGPTASGKTGIAVELLKHLPVELISVDSALVFRDMDIGTAKPDAATLARAPHHLIDIINPTEAYSAAAFRHDALRLMSNITQREKIPLLVGGTMLYFKALREGLSDLPQSNPEIRAALDAEIAQHGIEHLHKQLAAVDAETAARLQPTDTQRIQRAMEIYRITGQPMSALIKKPQTTVPSPASGRGLGRGLSFDESHPLPHPLSHEWARGDSVLPYRIIPIRPRPLRPRPTPRPHRHALQGHAETGIGRRTARSARKISAASEHDLDALRRLPSGMAIHGRRDR